MSFLWKAIGGVLGAGGSIPNFPYSIGPIVDTHATATLTWNLHQGTRDEDRAPVTIFCCDIGDKSDHADPGARDLARNALKRAKLLMLPGLLRCFEAVEYNQCLYIATEECRPLSKIMQEPTLRVQYFNSSRQSGNDGEDDADEDPFDMDSDAVHDNVALGLKHISQALIAMHKHSLQHGNVCHESVFVVRSGEWRLFGHEFVGDWKEENSLYRRLWSILPEYRRPPETMQSSSTSPFHSVSSVDTWGLGALIFAVFSFVAGKKHEALKPIKTADMRAFRVMPRSLHSGYVGITGANPKLRMTLEKFLAETEFVCGSEFVNSLQQLEELALKDAADRDALYRLLTNLVDKFPLRACKYLILSKLNNAVTYSGGASATALEPILKIGARLADPADFAELVAPVVMTLFNSPDRTVRMRLLTSASQYARLLPQALVNEKIWPLFASGFSSPDANLREHTVRALVHFAPLLQEKTVSGDALRYITALQQDREGPIRTNATICLCLIASYLGETSRSKTLVHGFGRMLKDPFLPSRMAALKSIQTTLPHITPQMLAEILIPAVVPLTLDVGQEVREKALEVVEIALQVFRKASSELTEKQVAAAAAAGPNSGSASTSGGIGTPSIPTASSTSFLSQWGWGSASNANLAPDTPVGTSPTPPPPPPPSVASSSSFPSRPATDSTDVNQSKTSVKLQSGSATPKTSSNSMSTGATVKSNNHVDAAAAASKGNSGGGGGWDEEEENWDDTAPTSTSAATKKPMSVLPRPSGLGSSSSGAKPLVVKKKGFGGATKAE